MIRSNTSKAQPILLRHCFVRSTASNIQFIPPANEVCEGNVFTGICLSTGGCLCPGVSVQGVFVQEGFCPGGGLRAGGLCTEGSLSVWVSVQGCLCQGDLPYGKERAVCILLECILVQHVFMRKIIDFNVHFDCSL